MDLTQAWKLKLSSLLTREREVNNEAEDEQVAVIAAGVNLQKTSLGCVTWGHKFLLVQFRYKSPHEMNTYVFSKRRNRISEQTKMTRESQKQ